MGIRGREFVVYFLIIYWLSFQSVSLRQVAAATVWQGLKKFQGSFVTDFCNLNEM